jgi:drug/metabolite transporter (DMT)-like permease
VRVAHISLIAALVGALFWGLSSNAAQALFQTFHFPVLGLLSLRLLIAGSILLVIKRPQRPRRPYLPLVVFSILGLVGSQVTYLAAIQFSNAATATLLQFLFLPMVACYEALTGSLRWSVRWSITMILAATGTIFLIGAFSGTKFSILVTPLGLVSGLGAAASGAYYSIKSRGLMHSNDAWWLTCWGFIIGGIVTLPLGIYALVPYSLPSSITQQVEIFSLVGFVIVFGTLLAYGLYLSGLRKLSATEVGVAASVEPIAAATAGYFFLDVVLTHLQYLGAAMLLIAVAITASRNEKGKTRIVSDTTPT